jgi:hypothetical protein
LLLFLHLPQLQLEQVAQAAQRHLVLAQVEQVLAAQFTFTGNRR